MQDPGREQESMLDASLRRVATSRIGLGFVAIGVCVFSSFVFASAQDGHPGGECRGINPSVHCPAGSHCDLGSGHCVPDRVGKGGPCGGQSGIECEEGLVCVKSDKKLPPFDTEGTCTQP
jgi:hypothetical protein